ncbi:MAG: hypothetical protein JO152_15320 [Mycobacteriaceae bacterium]|nr:hypothetical protein [Mycobacteriaceae bacterium]
MGTSTVSRVRWWLLRVIGRNPLVRTTDRVEAALMALAIVISLAAMPVAATVGTAVHVARGELYAEQARSRHTVAATVTADNAAGANHGNPVALVRAQWKVGEVERHGVVKWDHPVKSGEMIDIWVDRQGNPAGAPTPPWRAGADAVSAAMGTWLLVAAAAAALFATVRPCLDRVRYAAWDRAITSLADHGGRTNRQP